MLRTLPAIWQEFIPAWNYFAGGLSIMSEPCWYIFERYSDAGWKLDIDGTQVGRPRRMLGFTLC